MADSPACRDLSRTVFESARVLARPDPQSRPDPWEFSETPSLRSVEDDARVVCPCTQIGVVARWRPLRAAATEAPQGDPV